MKNSNNMLWVVLISVMASTFAFGCRSVSEKTIVPISNFDIQKYIGKWYEVARLDFTFERGMNNVTAEYSLNDNGSVSIVNRGYNYVQHKWKKVQGKGRLVGSADTGVLKVSFFGPFYRDYIVLAVDDMYSYSLVGGKDRKHLWILGRTPEIPESIKRQYVGMAKSLGYNTDMLAWTVHSMVKN